MGLFSAGMKLLSTGMGLNSIGMFGKGITTVGAGIWVGRLGLLGKIIWIVGRYSGILPIAELV